MRMTAIRLADGSLFLHSPIPRDPEIEAALQTLGPVRHVVAPCRPHHFYIGEYRDIEGARLYAAPGLPEKRRDLRFDAVLSDDAPDAWAGEIDQHVFRGAPFMNEVVFFHRRSRTLILADLAFNFVECDHRPTRLWLRAVGALGRFGPPRHVRWMIRDRAAARASIETVLRWPIERVIVSHGVVLQQSARRLLRESFAWLPDA